jgi:Dienelactone hydrolase and related enzymes
MGAQTTVRTKETPAEIPVGDARLAGDLAVPRGVKGIVVFAHGSGSGRKSPRNRYVAELLRDAGHATLLFDLLTEEEEQEDIFTARLRFDIDLLSRRLVEVTDWVSANSDTSALAVGYFGASTGAAAALVAASLRPEKIKAVVSRGGRPDLAGDALGKVQAPTLLIVGGYDEAVIEMNREAAMKLNAPNVTEIVPGATHLFEEPGKLDDVAALAVHWFGKYFG